MSQIHDEVRETAGIGLKRLREYLESPSDDGEKVARVGVQAVRAFTSSESTHVRKLSAAISAAKLMGIQGEALAPVFAELSGAGPIALPSRERSGARADSAK